MQVRQRKALGGLAGLVVLASLLCAGAAVAATADPEPAQLSIFFDRAATWSTLILGPGAAEIVTAYVIAVHTEQTFGGAAYQLRLDPFLELVGASYPPGVQIGDPLWTGVQVGLTACQSGYDGVPVLVSTLTLRLLDSNQYATDLEVGPYPPAGAVQLADCDGFIREVPGGSARIIKPGSVAVTPRTWGRIKALYGR